MKTQEIIRALRCFASLKEGYDPMLAVENCPLTVLTEAADRLELMAKLAKDLDMLRAHMECFTEDAERWTDLATVGHWPATKKDAPNPYRAQTRLEMRHHKWEGFGEAHTNGQWAELLGLPRNTLARYLGKGMTIEEVAKMRGIKYPEG